MRKSRSFAYKADQMNKLLFHSKPQKHQHFIRKISKGKLRLLKKSYRSYRSYSNFITWLYSVHITFAILWLSNYSIFQIHLAPKLNYSNLDEVVIMKHFTRLCRSTKDLKNLLQVQKRAWILCDYFWVVIAWK